MCGITGYINPHGVMDSDLKKMNDAVMHRGPDDSGIYIDTENTIGLGHQRLSIIDLSGGRQPMSNEDDTIWITFNGEIYNFQELKKELEKNHDFKTKSDTETIVHLYQEKGNQCVQYLRGMFAFALYDTNKRTLFAARDHLGQKPFYYYHDGDVFAFGSEIKSLLALKPALRKIDAEALNEYLAIRIITPPRSMFRKIRKLPPGHFLIFQNGQLEICRYWNLRYQPKLRDSFEDILAELENQLASTIRYHLVSDVPVGAFLSGGMDSSLVVAMMRKVSDKTIHTFCGEVDYENYSEAPYARMVSEQYRTRHHELKIKPSLIRTLPDLVWHLDEPSDPLSVCMYSISELARKEVKVVLGGDGGDELFGGYDRYYGNQLVSYYALIPENIRRNIFGRLIDRVPEGFWYRSLSHKLKWMHQLSFEQGADRYAESLGYFYFSDDQRKSLYTDKFYKEVQIFDPEICIKDYFNSSNAEDMIDKMLYADSMTRMVDHPVMIQDRMTMAHGLEARSPFLDHKLVEFCASIPSRFKVRGTRRRYIQTQLAKKYLPSALTNRKKQGFSSSLPYILTDEYHTIYDSFLNASHLVRDGYFQRGAIDTLLQEHLMKKSDHGCRLWLLCNSEIWYRMHIENESANSIRMSLSNY